MGGDFDTHWTEISPDPTIGKIKRKNPITQNDGRCVAMANKLGKDAVVTNIIIFPRLESKDDIDSSHVFTIE